MKIRVKIPFELINTKDRTTLPALTAWVDDILIWGKDTEIDIEFCTYCYDQEDCCQTNRWAVFTVDNDYSYMFSLKYGATLHKSQQEK